MTHIEEPVKAPKALIIDPVGTNDRGELELRVRLRRRSMYALRLLYRSAREHGLGRLVAARLATRVVLADATPDGEDRQ